MVVVVEGFHFCLNIDDHGNAYDVIQCSKDIYYSWEHWRLELEAPVASASAHRPICRFQVSIVPIVPITAPTVPITVPKVPITVPITVPKGAHYSAQGTHRCPILRSALMVPITSAQVPIVSAHSAQGAQCL